jgi:hypothetical protein
MAATIVNWIKFLAGLALVFLAATFHLWLVSLSFMSWGTKYDCGTTTIGAICSGLEWGKVAIMPHSPATILLVVASYRIGDTIVNVKRLTGRSRLCAVSVISVLSILIVWSTLLSLPRVLHATPTVIYVVLGSIALYVEKLRRTAGPRRLIGINKRKERVWFIAIIVLFSGTLLLNVLPTQRVWPSCDISYCENTSF